MLKYKLAAILSAEGKVGTRKLQECLPDLIESMNSSVCGATPKTPGEVHFGVRALLLAELELSQSEDDDNIQDLDQEYYQDYDQYHSASDDETPARFLKSAHRSN